MKNLTLKLLLALCLTGRLLSAVAQPAGPETPEPNAPALTPPPGPGDLPPPTPEAAMPPPDAASPSGDETATPPAATPSPAPLSGNRAVTNSPADKSIVVTTVVDDSSTPTPEAPAVGTNIDELRMNFRNAPLDLVLKYLSDAAGFIIVMDTQVRGNVNIISSHPMTRSEAVDLLNSVLNKNGYAAIRNGRTLTIVEKNDAKTRNIPVKTSNDPTSIPDNAEIVTQIIPIRFVEARQLVTDLSSFVSPQATIVANEAGNSIVVTDTQSNIRHLAEIIRAIDDSAEGETEIRVFHLKYANPSDVASELASIFPSGGTGTGTQSPIRFGGGGPGGFGGFGGGGGPGGFFARMAAANASSNPQTARVQKQTQVLAVADARTQSVIVTASKDLMAEIASMMTQLDVPSNRDQKVYVYHMNNGDPQETLQVLQSMFQNSSTTSRTGTSSQNSALQNRQTQNATTTGTSTSTGGFGTGTQRVGGGGNLF
ncbi:MAG TPA: secretin N-terminal domain-containing protein [Candidatus Acidoferrum sp.]|nr:secretin N-terminal domain-containing protein [Candidatus Acidoferrum sp.]